MLFSLIKSLTQTEKRYFKLFANTYSKPQNKYLELFSIIESQDKFNTKEILSHFRTKKLTINLNADKKYLYQMILNALQAYHKNVSPKMRIRNLIAQGEIALSKNLKKPSLKLISKAKDLSVKHEEFAFLIELYELEKKASIAFLNESQMKAFIDNAAYNTDVAFERLKNMYAYYQIADKSSYFFKLKKEEDLEKWRKVCFQIDTNPLFQDESKALSIKAKNIFYLVQALDANIDDDFKRVYKLTKKWKSRIEKALQKITLGNTLDSEMNVMYLSSCIRLNKRQEFEQGISLIKSDTECLRRSFEIILNLEIHYYGINNLYKEGYPKISALEQNIMTLKKEISFPRFSTLVLNLVEFYFGGGFYKEASSLINEILLDKNSSKLSYATIMQYRLFNLFVLYELKEFSLLYSQCISTKYYLQKSKNKSKINSHIVDMFLVLDKSGYIAKFKAKLDLLSELLDTQKSLEHDESNDFLITIRNWLNSKLNVLD